MRLDFSIFSMHISAYVLVFGRVLSEAPGDGETVVDHRFIASTEGWKVDEPSWVDFFCPVKYHPNRSK
jgi:hypothetical protein